MARSYRRPFSSLGSGYKASAHEDKTLAARGYRRLANQYINNLEDYEECLVPKRYTATHNQCWCWKRDGRNQYWPKPTWSSSVCRAYRFHIYRWYSGSDYSLLEPSIEEIEREHEKRLKSWIKCTRK